MSLKLGDPRDSQLDTLAHADKPGELRLRCHKCTAGAVFYAIDMGIACELANDAGWFLEISPEWPMPRMVCPKCPGVRPKAA